MANDKHWKTVKMGSADEGCGLSVSCWGGKVIKGAMGYIMGAGYDPTLEESQAALFESTLKAIDEKLKSQNIILQTNEAGDKRVMIHKISEGDTQVKWSLQQKN